MGSDSPVLSRRCFDGVVCPLFGLVITISFNRVFGNLPSSRFHTQGFQQALMRKITHWIPVQFAVFSLATNFLVKLIEIH